MSDDFCKGFLLGMAFMTFILGTIILTAPVTPLKARKPEELQIKTQVPTESDCYHAPGGKELEL